MHLKTSITVILCLNIHFNDVLSHPHLISSSSGEISWESFRKAIIDGNEHEVTLLVHSTNLNAVDGNGNSALHLAAERGLEKIVKQLIDNGADINGTNQLNNNSALILAIQACFEKTAELIVQNGANVNIVGDQGNTALILAAENGFERIVQILIEKDANVNAVNEKEYSAIVSAAEKGREAIVRMLLENGAVVTGSEKHAPSALNQAILRGFDKIAELLIENGADVNVVGNADDTALIYASEKGFEKIAQMLIAKGANVNALNAVKYSALIYAAESGRENIARLLIENGADINAVNRYRNTALIAACENVYDDVAELLIQNGADVNAVGNSGNTALTLASSKGLEKIVQMLIARGANVNAVDENGDSALILATKKGRERIVRILLENGANTNVANKSNKTALIYAVEKEREELIRLLTQHGAESGDTLLYKDTAEKACRLYSNLTARWNHETSMRVSHGSLASDVEFPWMVALGYLKQQHKISFLCGGSLISDTFVLTAAHCVNGILQPVVTRLGKITFGEEGAFLTEQQNIKEIIPHPEYSLRTKKNDIALIQLIDRLWITEFIQPICLQTDLMDEDPQVDLIVTGWRKTTNFNVATSQLQKVDLKTMPLPECNNTFLGYEKVHNLPMFQNGVDESQYCAHDPSGYQDSCQEDSGGPLQTARSYSNPAKVVGVVSFGTCGRLRASIYTRVAHYVEWIGSHVWPNGTIDTLQIKITITNE